MLIELIVPKVGESITEVQIADWLKAVGDRVERDGNVAVIETDKATVELPSPVAGVLAKIVKGKGEMAKVGDVIGYVEDAIAPGNPPVTPVGKPSAHVFPETTKIPVVKPVAPPKAATTEAVSGVVTPAPVAAVPAVSASTGADSVSVRPAAPSQAFVMPAAARALAESGTPAADITATGPGGRLLKEDVLRHTQSGADQIPPATVPAALPPTNASPGANPPQPKPATAKASASAGSTSPVSAASPASSSADRVEEVVPMSMLRRKVAERLVQAQQNAALLTTFNEIDMTAMSELRQRHQDAFVKKYGIKLGYMSFFVKAAVDALKLIPQINAEIRGNEIIYKHYCDIGLAVGGGKGLVVPILRNAERLGFAQVELAIADFAKRAQANALKLEELQGGTFTISNGGVYGSLLSTPIVNPPQSGVLGMHAIQDRPVARNGQVVIRPMMYVALTYDHRIVDGREAVTFLKRIKDALEDPARLLLEI